MLIIHTKQRHKREIMLAPKGANSTEIKAI